MGRSFVSELHGSRFHLCHPSGSAPSVLDVTKMRLGINQWIKNKGKNKQMKRQDGHIPWVVFILPASILCTKESRSEPQQLGTASAAHFQTLLQSPGACRNVFWDITEKKNRWKDGFGSFCLWVELSWSWSWWDLGEKHSPQEVFVLRNSLFTTC